MRKQTFFQNSPSPFTYHRELFLKTNAQLTFRCRQLLSELSYIYPIDMVSEIVVKWYIFLEIKPEFYIALHVQCI
ncbi:UV radiation resistance-associated gene protein [Arapaima gigas]